VVELVETTNGRKYLQTYHNHLIKYKRLVPVLVPAVFFVRLRQMLGGGGAWVAHFEVKSLRQCFVIQRPLDSADTLCCFDNSR
jgi:hypothetical protein